MTRSTSLLASSDLAIPPGNRVSAGLLWLSVFEIALIASTSVLWFGKGSFPSVPLIPASILPSWLNSAGHLFAGSMSVLILVSATALAMAAFLKRDSSRWAGRFALLGLTCAVLLVLDNQHRLQAWHWLFLLNLAGRVCLSRDEQLQVMRQIVITVYVCSALSRITTNPTNGMTALIVQQLLTFPGLKLLAVGDSTFATLCHLMTLGEFAVGMLLWIRPTRQIGCAASITLHLTLLLAVGPFGLQHHAGVLLWNLCFLFVVPALFRGTDAPQSTKPPAACGRKNLAILLVWLFPVSGLFGIADNWPSWQLYSSRPESWILWIHESDRHHAPDQLTGYLSPPAPLTDWSAVKLDRLSLAETASPLYPEDRFQYAVIQDVLSQFPDDVAFRVEISEPLFPQWWRRRTRSITTKDELEREGTRFILGAVSRPVRHSSSTR